MTAGTGDKKKVIALCVLGAFALYMVYSNLLSGPSTPAPDRPPRASAADTAALGSPSGSGEQPVSKRAPAVGNRNRSDEWHPVLRAKRQEQALDPEKVDPTLRLNLLAKLQQVEPAGGTRNLFQISATPPTPAAGAAGPKGPEPTIAWVPVGPRQPAPPAPPAPPPPPPPIPLKFYGFSTVRDNGQKTAYFLDGDEILLAGEGQTVKRRYRVVRIGPKSVLMEDTESKHQQTLPLAEEAQS
jgi:hypothetical protein